MEATGHSPPQAREEGLLWRDLPDGLMVYDQERHEAHSLNQTAALVWRRCDGKTSVPELAAMLPQELNLPADEELIWLALQRLQKAHLLQHPLHRPAETAAISRREAIRKLGKVGAAAALVPLVTTIASPPASAQASPSNVASCEGKSANDPCTVAVSGVAGTCQQAGPNLVCVPNGPP
jgi:hypothetical protein